LNKNERARANIVDTSPLYRVRFIGVWRGTPRGRGEGKRRRRRQRASKPAEYIDAERQVFHESAKERSSETRICGPLVSASRACNRGNVKRDALTQDAPQSPPPRVWKAGMHLNVILSSTAELLSKGRLRFPGHNLPRTKRNT